MPFYIPVKSQNWWRHHLRGPLITLAPPTTTLKCYDGRWPQHTEQAAPQWNAAHGSTTLVVHGTRRCCDPPVRPPCWRRMRHNGLHGSITMEAKYEHHLCGSMQRHSGTRRSRGTSWARSVRQCGRDPRPTASMAMRAPRRGVARTHRAAVLATMMCSRTTVARLRGAPHSGAAWRARVSLATPRWYHPRHCGTVIPPVGKHASASTPLVSSVTSTCIKRY